MKKILICFVFVMTTAHADFFDSGDTDNKALVQLRRLENIMLKYKKYISEKAQLRYMGIGPRDSGKQLAIEFKELVNMMNGIVKTGKFEISKIDAIEMKYYQAMVQIETISAK